MGAAPPRPSGRGGKSLGRDAQLALELSYCAPRGLPHSTFLSWSLLDRQRALWWLVHERQRCQSCGTRPDEWDPEQGGDLHAFVATGVHCRGCEVIEPVREQISKGVADKSMRRGTTAALRPPPPEQHQDDQEVAGGDDRGAHG